MKLNNNISPFAEEIKIEQPTAQKVIQEILNREEFKQPVPTNFIKLKLEEGNYMGSTNPKWKDKHPCERYGFYSEEGEWIQIDITHELMAFLEIELGEDITYPLYLSPKVFNLENKKPIRGAITIEGKEEIFVDKPVSEKAAERELIKRLKELEELRKELEKLEKDKQVSQETIISLQAEITISEDNLKEAKEDFKKLKNEKEKLKKDLEEKNQEITDLKEEVKGKDNKLTNSNTKLTRMNW